MNVLRHLAAISLVAALGGCYVVPVTPEGAPWAYPYGAMLPPVVPPAPAAARPTTQILAARLYPQNEKAAQAGALGGSILSPAAGKGRFTLDYRGEVLAGEATRLDGDGSRGVANAYGPSGTFMTCEYQMRNPRTGVGSCSISDGARYQVHVGD